MPGNILFKGYKSPQHTLSQDVFGITDGHRFQVASTGSGIFSTSHENVLLVLSDGLGAHPIGRTAAAICVTSFLRLGPSPGKYEILNTAEATHTRLQKLSNDRSFPKCAGATIAGVSIRGECATFFSAGDIGIFVNMKSSRPLFAPDRSSTGRLTNCIGGTYKGGVEVRFSQERISEEFVVCTDGAWERSDFNPRAESPLVEGLLTDDALKVTVNWIP